MANPNTIVRRVRAERQPAGARQKMEKMRKRREFVCELIGGAFLIFSVGMVCWVIGPLSESGDAAINLLRGVR